MGFKRLPDGLRGLCDDFRMFQSALLQGLRRFSAILESSDAIQRVCQRFGGFAFEGLKGWL